MSAPQEVADEASRFTLRSIFTQQQQQHGAPAAAALHAAAHEQQPPPPQPPQPQPQQCRQLRFDLATSSQQQQPGPEAALTAAAAAAGFKFTLPVMRSAGAARSGGLGGQPLGGEKKLQPGYVAGGFADANHPEIMRLNSIVHELHSKLRKSSERVATAEQSVARGNAALQSERSTAHARIVALASEVKNAQHREANVRAELVAVPSVDRAKFEMQARGAVELQASYEDELRRAEGLQEAVDGLTAKHDAVVAEHAALQTRLDAATAELSSLRDEQQVAAPEMAMTVDDLARMATPVDVNGRRSQFMVSTETHLEAMRDLERALNDARCEILVQDANTEAERRKVAAADALIKSLDHKLASAREATRAAQERHAALEEFTLSVDIDRVGGNAAATAAADAGGGGAPPLGHVVPERWVEEFQQYFALKQKAEHAAAAIECAGATTRMIEDAMDLHACARRKFWCMQNNESEPSRPLIGHCVRVEAAAAADATTARPAEHIDVRAIRNHLCTSMNTNAFQMGVATALSEDDCAVDLLAVPLATTGHVDMSHLDEVKAVGLQLRTTAYITAVSGDIKAKLVSQSNSWKSAETGERPAAAAAAAQE